MYDDNDIQVTGYDPFWSLRPKCSSYKIYTNTCNLSMNFNECIKYMTKYASKKPLNNEDDI